MLTHIWVPAFQRRLLFPDLSHLHTRISQIYVVIDADDQILMATSEEDDLQTMAHHLNLIARKYKMTISSTKRKTMAMWGNHIQRVNIVINDNIIEQVTDFK